MRGSASTSDRVEALLDTASLLPGGKLLGEAHHGLEGLDALTGAARHADDLPTPHGINDIPGGGHVDTPVDPSAAPHSGNLPPTGEPGSYGYGADGNRLPYANGGRPAFGPNQVEDTWLLSRDEQLGQIGDGRLDLPTPGDNEQWVLLHPDGPIGDGWTVESGHRLIEWQPGDPRNGLWDMGHVPGEEYRLSKDDYLSGNLSYEDFLDIYRDPNNYRVQDPFRNRSHIDEGP